MKKLFLFLLASGICFGAFSQRKPKEADPAKEAAKEAQKEKARKRATYSYFSACPIKELKKDTLTMDELFLWKSFYDSLGLKINISKMTSYVQPDSVHKKLIVVSSELNAPEDVNAHYEKLLNKGKKKYFIRKEMDIRKDDLKYSQRSIPDAPPSFYMLWIEGGDEPDSSTIGELPDTTIANISLNEYLVWQLFNKVMKGEFADQNSSTICSDMGLLPKKKNYQYPIATFIGGTPKSYFLDPATSGGNLPSAGPRSVKCVATKNLLDPKKKEVKAK